MHLLKISNSIEFNDNLLILSEYSFVSKSPFRECIKYYVLTSEFNQPGEYGKNKTIIIKTL